MSLNAVAAEDVAAAVPVAAVPTAAAPVSDPFSTEAVLQLVLVLFFIIALILALAWFARRTMGAAQGGQHMRVVAGLPLGAREKVVLVEVGKEQMLLGVAPGRVNLITRFDEPVVDSSSQPNNVFGQRLAEVLQRGAEK
ncbi:flagellar biosynthetic protein FliO [Pontibacterium granulatum]|uniref:flagellar biosynthetic protein FliO n=1 Tax=Pontibacterium granulatum TaxID=2036029 RepID=UPI00249AB38E|nr:flagellar biosynthetic protein FliO [Pontibacterium granulatum]MDI3322880.1 flagellar biosynthetic protein FliO [Pontibacterium granulatum]